MPFYTPTGQQEPGHQQTTLPHDEAQPEAGWHYWHQHHAPYSTLSTSLQRWTAVGHCTARARTNGIQWRTTLMTASSPKPRPSYVVPDALKDVTPAAAIHTHDGTRSAGRSSAQQHTAASAAKRLMPACLPICACNQRNCSSWVVASKVSITVPVMC